MLLLYPPCCFPALPSPQAGEGMVNTSGIRGVRVRMCQGQAESLGEGGCSGCVGAHVLIWICVEYERQAETQLVTSELAPVISGNTLPSATSSSTPRAPPSAQINGTGGGAGAWAGDTTQGPRFNKTKWNHLPPPKTSPSPWLSAASPLFPSLVTLCSLILQIGSAWEILAFLPRQGLRASQSTDEKIF